MKEFYQINCIIMTVQKYSLVNIIKFITFFEKKQRINILIIYILKILNKPSKMGYTL